MNSKPIFSICGEMKGELASLHKIVRILESVRLNFLFLLIVIHRIPWEERASWIQIVCARRLKLLLRSINFCNFSNWFWDKWLILKVWHMLSEPEQFLWPMRSACSTLTFRKWRVRQQLPRRSLKFHFHLTCDNGSLSSLRTLSGEDQAEHQMFHLMNQTCTGVY